MSERKVSSYVFHGQTTSLCDCCLAPVPTKILIEDNKVYYQKRCRTHGVRKALVSSDAAYWRSCFDWIKPGDRPNAFQTRVDLGCPYDCGLCPEHEQHSCLALIEINEHCNLTCPVCFASSSPSLDGTRSLAEVEAMLDALVLSEGEPDLLQISGGEPTMHPEILEILAAAKARPIRHLMLNTNGLRIARDPEFVAALASLKPGFEVYLQFDSLRASVHRHLRGADLTRIRRQALERLDEAGISTTLVVTVKKGQNDDEIGDILAHALEWPCVRGVTFQPVQDAGRNENFEPTRNRALLSDIRRAVIESNFPFGASDMIPLPCNPESISIGYGLRQGTSILPVTGYLPRDMLVDAMPNTVSFERFPDLQKRVFEFFSLSNGPHNAAERLEALLCCLPEVPVPSKLGYEDIFRVAIVEFLDPHNFCLSRVKRSCVHFVTPEGRIIPFDTYNLFYRDDAAKERRRKSLQGASLQAGGRME